MNVDTGAWTCFRCGAHGLLAEHKTPSDAGSSRRSRRHAERPTSAASHDLAEQATKRATLRRLWATTVSIDERAAVRGADYLFCQRGIPLLFAVEARVRFASDWYGRPAVVFPMVNESGRLVAAEGRYIAAGPKCRSAGTKALGIFITSPQALEGTVACICEGPITALSLATCGLSAIALCGQNAAPWLASRLALKTVYVALDWYEAHAAIRGKAIFRDLQAVRADCYHLDAPAGAGDWNDVLVTNGRQALRNALAAITT